MARLPRKLLDRIAKVQNRRAKIVLDTIVKKGSISTEELNQLGYNHPPRAARDVRELGFQLVTVRVKSRDGRSIGAYSFGTGTHDLLKTGRLTLPKRKRDEIIAKADERCQLCGATQNLQVDHRIPYEVAGESQAKATNPYQVLCGPCNRKKSWECEHCENWRDVKNVDICRTCYWASAEQYRHVALRQERRLEIVWQADEIREFDALKRKAKKRKTSVSEYAKAKLSETQSGEEI